MTPYRDKTKDNKKQAYLSPLLNGPFIFVSPE